MKQISFVLVILFCMTDQLLAQNKPVSSRIDLLLMRGDYEKVIDTCKQMVTSDSLNPDIYYKMGIAYQNTLEDDLSLISFNKAVSLNPKNNAYNFALAKAYYGKGKYKLAEPLLYRLCLLDSMKWLYSNYLTSIYVQSGRFDEAISVYKRFLLKDSANYVYLDKMAFASIKKGDLPYAKDLYSKSLSINPRDLSAIKNLAYCYASTKSADTAILLLTKGIGIDSSDMDLYVRRAQIYYSRDYTKRALNDYLVILASGDSSEIYLKRAGIGYCYNLQPREAINYLLKAYRKDSSDYETSSYLGQGYYKIKNMKSSAYYYNRVIKLLKPVNMQLGLTYVLCAESLKGNGNYPDAISDYLKAYDINGDPNLYMIIANIYDEKLNNKEKAIFYYQKFLNNFKKSKMKFTPEYVGKIEKRLEFLKNPPK
jgi:tetratricopeptide (TPR) repeat protein